MEEKELLTALALPKSTHRLRTFPFTKLATHYNSEQRKVFKQAVESRGIRLLATINTAATNIPSYQDDRTVYEEIHLFEIHLRNIKFAKRIYRLLAEAMPYALIIRFVSPLQTVWIAANHEKVEKTNLLRMVKLHLTEPKIDELLYIEQWAFHHADKYNLKTFYEHFIQQMIEVELHALYGATIDTEQSNEQLEQLKIIEKEIEKCLHNARKESQMKQRIEWQMKAMKLQEQQKRLMEGGL